MSDNQPSIVGMFNSGDDNWSTEIKEGRKGWDAKVSAISRLKDGWFDGEGIAPSAAVIALLEATNIEANKLNIKTYPRAYLFPMVEGGVQIEWQGKESYFEFDIHNDLSGELFSFENDEVESSRFETVTVTDIIKMMKES